MSRTTAGVLDDLESVHDSLEAAERLGRDRISVEVIDLRTLRPIDIETVLASPLEDAFLPGPERIVADILRRLR